MDSIAVFLNIEVIRLESLLLEWLSLHGLLLFCIGIVAAIIGILFGAAGFVLLPAMLLPFFVFILFQLHSLQKKYENDEE